MNDKFYASAVLIDNKIYAWKVGPSAWASCGHATMYLPMPEGEMRLETKEFHCNNTDENWDIFERQAPDWFSQWEIHPQFKGANPYNPNFKGEA